MAFSFKRDAEARFRLYHTKYTSRPRTAPELSVGHQEVGVLVKIIETAADRYPTPLRVELTLIVDNVADMVCSWRKKAETV